MCSVRKTFNLDVGEITSLRDAQIRPQYRPHKLQVCILYAGQDSVLNKDSFWLPEVVRRVHPVARMRRCQHQQCRRFALYNVDGSKTGAFCKQHAEDGMVDVCHERCSHDSCLKRPTYSIKGSNTPMYCKQHAGDGMMNVLSKRCSHDACTKLSSFYDVGSKTAIYCKQHAQDGMVSVDKQMGCSHDACTTQASFNVEGSRTAIYCKQHAEDGMVSVHKHKRCSYDSCTRQPSYNVEGSKKAVYCKRHAEDGMVNVRRKRCSHDCCKRLAYYNVESSTTPAYCQQHTQEGMVNVSTKRSLRDRGVIGPAQIVPTNVAATARTGHKSDIFDGSVNNSDLSSEVVNCRKRSGRELDGKPPPNALHPSPFKVDVVQTVEMCRSKEAPHTSSSTALQSHLHDDNTVGTAAKKSRQVVPLTMSPLPDEHQYEEPIKTEMVVDVLF